MTEATLAALGVSVIVSIAPTIAAVAGWLQGKANGKKVDAVAGKADEIHTLTNSNLAAVKADLALANQRIAELQSLVAALHDEREP